MHKAISVLLVDTSQALVAAVGRYLQHEGFVVAGFDVGGGGAIRKAQLLQPDVVVLDIALREPSGLGLIEALRSSVPGAAVVVFSLLDTPSLRRSAQARGAAVFVPKGAPTSQLLDGIRQAAASRTQDGVTPPGQPGEGELSGRAGW
ncbi:MAG: response regulator transcription factor [Candidatus Latescibacterota bacterium]